jgi:hypothetical protein
MERRIVRNAADAGNDLQDLYAGDEYMLAKDYDGRGHSFLRFADGITCQFNAFTLGTMPGRSAYASASNAAAIAD